MGPAIIANPNLSLGRVGIPFLAQAKVPDGTAAIY